MGFTPAQVDDMSMWQFAVCIEGWNTAHGGEPRPEPPTDDEFERMKRTLM